MASKANPGSKQSEMAKLRLAPAPPLLPPALLPTPPPPATRPQPHYTLSNDQWLKEQAAVIGSAHSRYEALPRPPPVEPNVKSDADRTAIKQVIEYLIKKGYNKTERTLRQESANLDKDGRPISDRSEDLGDAKYRRAFRLLSNWVEQNLDVYKVCPFVYLQFIRRHFHSTS